MCIVSGVVNTLYSGFLIVTFGGQLSWWTARFASGIAYAVWIVLVLKLRYLLLIYTSVKMYFTSMRTWDCTLCGAVRPHRDVPQGSFSLWSARFA